MEFGAIAKILQHLFTDRISSLDPARLQTPPRALTAATRSEISF